MAFLTKKNNAKSLLANAVSLIDSTIEVVDSSSFPSIPDFVITIWDKSSYPDPSDDPSMEVLKVTNISGNIFSVTRAQEDTSAKDHLAGHAVEHLFTAGQLHEIEQFFDNFLNKTNTVLYTPTLPYHPATKEYVDSQLQGENHWDILSGNTLSPHIFGASLNIGTGNFWSTGIGGFGSVQHNITYIASGLEPTGTTYWDDDNHCLASVYSFGISHHLGMFGIPDTNGQIPVWDNTNKYFDFTENINNFARLDGSNQPFTDTIGVKTTDANKRTHFVGQALTPEVPVIPGTLGNALDFDADGSDVASFSDITLSGDFTIAMWINPDAIGTIIGSVSAGCRFDIANSGGLYMRFSDGTTQRNFGYIPTPGWYLAVLRRSSGTVNVWYNNVAQTGNTASASVTFNRIGQNNLVNYFDGKLDEIAIWNRALTTDEMAEIYASGSGKYLVPSETFSSTGTLISQNLQALWHLDEGTGTTAADASGNGKTLTCSNQWVTGKVTTGDTPAVPAHLEEVDVVKVVDGNTVGENGVQYFSDTKSKTHILGTEINLDADTTVGGDISADNLSGTNTGDQESSDFDHDALQNTHNLTTDIDHNEVSGLQGGTTDEYYHVTAAEKAVLEDTSGENTGDQDLSPYATLEYAYFRSN